MRYEFLNLPSVWNRALSAPIPHRKHHRSRRILFYQNVW